MSSFFNQGAVPLGNDAYVPRVFEDQVFEEVIAGGWVLLLGPRQHGKTTGLVRLSERLGQAGLSVAKVDLQGLPPHLDYPAILEWVSSQLADSLDLSAPQVNAGETDFLIWLGAIFPADSPPMVIFVDEAANIPDEASRNAFYGQIRQIANLRADRGATHIPAKIRFVFTGTFRPEKLVADLNSPFNVCRIVETEDLALAQARALVENVKPGIMRFVDPIFEVVGGQPYLLQTVYKEEALQSRAPVDEIMQNLLPKLPQLVRGHLEGLFGKIISDAKLCSKVAQMVREGFTELTPADSDCSFLQIVGIAKREGVKLVFRNELYRDVAARNPKIMNPSSSEVVLLVHGIRTDANWAEMVRANLEDLPKRVVIPVRYGFMGLFQFLFPFWTRNRVIQRIRIRIQQAHFENPDANLSVIAHSFGTYAIGQILQGTPDTVLHRLILCGSILPTEFKWYQLGDRIPATVVNECGSKDIWPPIAAFLSSCFGASGTFGFGNPRVRDRFHPSAHSGYFDAQFVSAFWKPYFATGSIVTCDWEKQRPASPWWMQQLPRYRLRIIFILAVLVVLVIFLA